MAVLAVVFVACFVFFFWTLIGSAKKAPVSETPLNPDQQKMQEIMTEMDKLFISLGDFESIRNGRKYLEVLNDAEEKMMAVDELWEKTAAPKRAAMDGMISGMNEYYQGRFSSAEKLQMLSEKYGIEAEKLKRLKADFQIMFAEEFAEKFYPVAETVAAPEGEAAEEKPASI